MLIRTATLSDIPNIMKLIAEVVPVMIASGNLQWDSTYPNAEIFTNDIKLNQLWVAEIDKQIGGIIAITKDQSPEYAQIGWDITEPAIVTHRLAVNVNYQGRGIAGILLQQAEHEAVRQGIKLLRIDKHR